MYHLIRLNEKIRYLKSIIRIISLKIGFLLENLKEKLIKNIVNVRGK